MTELPAELVLCVLLEELSLENNAILSLPYDLYGCLEKLSSVQLSRNKFETFPVTQAEHLSHMNSLNIEHNHINLREDPMWSLSDMIMFNIQRVHVR